MELLYVMFVLVLFGLTIFILVKNKKLKSVLFKTESNLVDSENNVKLLTIKVNNVVGLLSTNKTGFYIGTTTLLSEEDKKNGIVGEKYTYIVYIKELDRYTNGMSKIQFTDMEVTSGYHHDQYKWVKELETNRFASLKKTNEIEWLESEIEIKDARRKKLNKILNSDKK